MTDLEQYGFYVCQMTGGGLCARERDGWMLAECTESDEIFNGSTDGTEKGRRAFQVLVEILKKNRDPVALEQK